MANLNLAFFVSISFFCFSMTIDLAATKYQQVLTNNIYSISVGVESGELPSSNVLITLTSSPSNLIGGDLSLPLSSSIINFLNVYYTGPGDITITATANTTGYKPAVSTAVTVVQTQQIISLTLNPTSADQTLNFTLTIDITDQQNFTWSKQFTANITSPTGKFIGPSSITSSYGVQNVQLAFYTAGVQQIVVSTDQASKAININVKPLVFSFQRGPPPSVFSI
jgi:hypothetical protein